jgi:hypothetical protein
MDRLSPCGAEDGADGLDEAAWLAEALGGDEYDRPARGVRAVQPVAVPPDPRQHALPRPVVLVSSTGPYSKRDKHPYRSLAWTCDSDKHPCRSVAWGKSNDKHPGGGKQGHGVWAKVVWWGARVPGAFGARSSCWSRTPGRRYSTRER